ncbi:hypothetical protein PF008_g29720 [Phytophthora fragariae]|uniref:Uncharacterized protein n=5 Tax=Phytophthora fragariae TaxID=53985 RepID=A0A6G0Q7K9_9STRA|nr:hypothetical protein PF003_g9290 [Phytophthora fragariae]KAE9273943.1 hypothetical protein PF008_g29720 [Phytophthora fragariae]
MKPQVSSLDELIHVLAGHAQPPAEPASLLPMELTPSAQLFAVGHTSSSTEANREGSDHYEQQQLQHAPDAEGFEPKTNGLSDQLQEKSEATTTTLSSKRKQKQKKQAALKETTPGDERKERNSTLTKDGGRARPSTTTERFVKFQRAEAMGQFSVLADSDSEEDEVAFMDVDEGKQEFDAAAEEEDRDEAPYAYDGDSAADESATV